MPFTIVRDDITRMRVDAIVNPANPQLLRGGGCCGAIFRAAGPELDKACAKLGPCPTGEARITPGFKLPAKYIIHTPGPVWNGGHHDEERLLKSSYTQSLRLAAQNGCRSIAFPLISSGIYGYPKGKALDDAVAAINDWLMNEDDGDTQVYLILFDKSAFTAGGERFPGLTAYIDDNYEGVHRFEAEASQRGICFNRRERPNVCAMRTPFREVSPEDAELDSDAICENCAPKDLSLPDLDFPELDESFSQMLFRLIDAKGLKDSEVYKKANVDRKLFAKLKDPAYHVGKRTALALAIGLELDLPTTRELLEKAGYAISHANLGDVIVEYYIKHKRYNIIEINMALYEHDQQLLTS